MSKKSLRFLISFLIVFFLFLGIVYFTGKKIGKLYAGIPSISSNTLVEVYFDKPVVERPPLIPFRNVTPFHRVIKALYHIPEDKNVKAVLVFGNKLPLNIAQIEELRDALDYIVKNGKKVFVYFDEIGTNYCVVPKGGEVIMHPTPGRYVALSGYYTVQPMFKTLLEEKLGIKFTVTHIGNYKGAGEPFVRDKMSQYLKKELIELYESDWDSMCEMISKARGFNKNEFEKNLYDGKYFFLKKEDAKKSGFVDTFDLPENIESRFNSTISISSYSKTLSSLETKPIALIIGEGEVVMGKEEPSVFGSTKSVIASETMCKIIRRAADDNSVKAIVFRIDSPGGSALASELINRELKKAAKKKPVIISVGHLAASGGYYISSAGDEIIADRTSIVGSIGVVSLVPEITELSKRIGINFEEIKRGKFSDFFSPFKSPTDEEKQLLKKSMLEIYSLFKQRVAEGRKLDLKYVESIAQGRFYSGRKGLELKLVDRIGGLHEALVEASKRAGLKSTDYTVFTARKSFWEMLQEDFNTKTDLNSLIENQIKAIKRVSLKPLLLEPCLAMIDKGE